MQCLACGKRIRRIDNAHLAHCCGLTLQEYSIRYKVPLDVLVPQSMLGCEPPPSSYPVWQAPQGEAAIILSALRAVGSLKKTDLFYIIDGEIRRLDQLLWLAQKLSRCGFVYRQTYGFHAHQHRVVAGNALKALRPPGDLPELSLNTLSSDDFLLWLATVVACHSDFYHGYLFLRLAEKGLESQLAQRLETEFAVRLKSLSPLDHATSYSRAQSPQDAQTLLKLLKTRLMEIPVAKQRFYDPQPQASVAREQGFDCAHFITDHPGQCVNLHGGHYRMIVKIQDRIDPYTGFVLDYGYLSQALKKLVINRLDHQCLNQVSAKLAWRSSTELINEFAWHQLLDYFPNMREIQTYETEKSYCVFRGPSLEEREQGPATSAGEHFLNKKLGQNPMRAFLDQSPQRKQAQAEERARVDSRARALCEDA